MKTRIYQALAIAFMFTFVAANAYAVDGRTVGSLVTAPGPLAVNLGEGDTGNMVTVNCSKGVALQYSGTSTKYSLGTVHMSGNREFGSDYNTGGIWYGPCNATGDACGTSYVQKGGVAETTDVEIISGWSAL